MLQAGKTLTIVFLCMVMIHQFKTFQVQQYIIGPNHITKMLNFSQQRICWKNTCFLKSVCPETVLMQLVRRFSWLRVYGLSMRQICKG